MVGHFRAKPRDRLQPRLERRRRGKQPRKPRRWYRAGGDVPRGSPIYPEDRVEPWKAGLPVVPASSCHPSAGVPARNAGSQGGHSGPVCFTHRNVRPFNSAAPSRSPFTLDKAKKQE
jgi:hypothetical protein